MSSLVPEGWSAGKLSDVSEKIWIGLVTTMTKFYVETGVPMIRNSDIKDSGINPSTLIHLENAFANENLSRTVKKGDVVFFKTKEELGGTLGVCIGQKSIFRAKNGVETRDTNSCNFAWRIE